MQKPCHFLTVRKNFDKKIILFRFSQKLIFDIEIAKKHF